MAFIMPAMMTVMNFTMLAIVWFGGLRLAAGKMQFGDIMAFIQYVNLILFSLMMVSMLFIIIPRAECPAGRINEVLEIQPSIMDPENPVKHGTGKGRLGIQKCFFHLQGSQTKGGLRNIVFSRARRSNGNYQAEQVPANPPL